MIKALEWATNMVGPTLELVPYAGMGLFFLPLTGWFAFVSIWSNSSVLQVGYISSFLLTLGGIGYGMMTSTWYPMALGPLLFWFMTSIHDKHS